MELLWSNQSPSSRMEFWSCLVLQALVLLCVVQCDEVDDFNQTLMKDRQFVFAKMREKYLLQDPRVEKVLNKYNRANFLPFLKSQHVYKDKYIYLGCGAEFSSPFVQAEALHLLRNHLKPGATVLELGSGTGYLATCMAELLQGNGSVIGLDLVAPLVDFSHKTSVEVAPHLIEQNVLKFFVADGRYGYKPCAPYDVIYTDCSLRSIPSVLLDQLKPGGRIVMTLGRTELPQYLIAIDKDPDGIPSFSRIRIRNKVPRLCSNIKEQDLYYQRMYPFKHQENLPMMGQLGNYGKGSYYTLSELSILGKPLGSEEMEHFAAAEKRYQEKVEQNDMIYNMDDPHIELARWSTTTKAAMSGGFGRSTTQTTIGDYEIWSLGENDK